MPDAPPPSGASPLPAAKPAGTHITYGEAGAQSSAEALAAAKQSGNITVQDANAETLALPAVRACTCIQWRSVNNFKEQVQGCRLRVVHLLNSTVKARLHECTKLLEGSDCAALVLLTE